MKIPFPNPLRLPVVRFAIVGAINTAVDFCLFMVLAAWAGLPVALSNTLSYSAGVACSFALNRTFTFGDRSPARQALRQLALFVVRRQELLVEAA